MSPLTGSGPRPSMPVFTFPKDFPPDVVEHEERLTVFGVSDLKHRRIEGMEIVDAKGRKFIVKKAERIGYPKRSLFGFRLISERSFLMNLEIQSTGERLAPRELRELVVTRMKEGYASDLFDGEVSNERAEEIEGAFPECDTIGHVFAGWKRYYEGETAVGPAEDG